MSRIGRKPIQLPANVSLSLADDVVSVKGPKGELQIRKRPEISIEVDGQTVVVENRRPARDRAARAYHGMTRALLQNMVVGVTQGFERKLEINGVGYQAKLEQQDIVLSLGFADERRIRVPDTVTAEVPNPTTVVIRGTDKQQVGEIAARIRKLRPPEPYKGKGIKYDYEIVRRKAGKAFGSA